MFMAKDDCGSIQMLTDVSIDPAGTIWAANNWNALDGMAGLNLGRRIGLHGHLWRGPAKHGSKKAMKVIASLVGPAPQPQPNPTGAMASDDGVRAFADGVGCSVAATAAWAWA